MEREKGLAQAGPPQAGTLDPLLGKQMLYRLSYSRSIALEAFLLNQAAMWRSI